MTDSKASPPAANENESGTPRPPAAHKDGIEKNIFRANKKQYAIERDLWLKSLPSQYAPISEGLTLGPAEEEDALDHQILVIAQAEALASRSQRRLERLATMTKAAIIAEFFANHPAMERFVAKHRAAGTCGQAVEEIETERQRRFAGPPSKPALENIQSVLSPAPPQLQPPSRNSIAAFVSDYLSDCEARGNHPTQSGCEKLWKDTGRGSKDRDTLRSEFKNLVGGLSLPRGRPQKIATNNSQE